MGRVDQTWSLIATPHDEHVKLYKSYADNRYTLVHALTLERVKLAPGIEWDTAYDDNGYGGVFDSKLLPGSEPFMMEHLFKQHVCKVVKTSRLQIYDVSGRKPVVYDWDHRLKAFTTVDMTIKVGAMAKDHQHRAFQLKVSRGGCVCFVLQFSVHSFAVEVPQGCSQHMDLHQCTQVERCHASVGLQGLPCDPKQKVIAGIWGCGHAC